MPAAQLVYLALEVIIVLAWLPRAWEGHYFILAIAIMIAVLAVEHASYYFAACYGQKQRDRQKDLAALIARNRKYWDEYDRLMRDPLFRSGIEVWVPPSLASRTATISRSIPEGQ